MLGIFFDGSFWRRARNKWRIIRFHADDSPSTLVPFISRFPINHLHCVFHYAYLPFCISKIPSARHAAPFFVVAELKWLLIGFSHQICIQILLYLIIAILEVDNKNLGPVDRENSFIPLGLSTDAFCKISPSRLSILTVNVRCIWFNDKKNYFPFTRVLNFTLY